MREFRFGFQHRTSDPVELVAQARAAEAAGFDVFHTWDHFGDGFSALEPLVAVAAATERMRLCPLVLNNDFHHPALLAQRLATIDRLSGGRLEVGIGAGHSFTEYAALGLGFDPPPVRKARLRESVEILRSLLDGEVVTSAGEHYRMQAATILRPQQAHVPMMVAVNGRTALAHAARHADIVGLTMLGRTLEDGNRHEVRWQADRLDTAVEHIRRAAGDRADDLELNALVQSVVITEDRTAAAEEIAAQVGGLSVDDALATPFLALGTTDEIVAQLLAARERWGISYFSVRDVESFAPVIAALRQGTMP